jgi:hypothetical protein
MRKYLIYFFVKEIGSLLVVILMGFWCAFHNLNAQQEEGEEA